MNFLTGTSVLEELKSPINGKIRVIKSLGFGTYIQADGLTQSGGVVYDVWKSTLRKLKGKKQEVKDCLILGLGGGSAATLIRKFWPGSKITGVDIDPIMISLGKKYLGLRDVKVVIGDASRFLKNNREKYDLVLVDLYFGHNVPEKFQKEDFIKGVRSLLSEQGIAVFNRLYFGEKRSGAMKFLKKLEKVFPKVTPFYPEANVMFVCQTDRI